MDRDHFDEIVSKKRLDGVLRSQIERISIPVTVTSFTTAGCTAREDSGRGARYIRGTSNGPAAVQDASGAFWQLARSDSVKLDHFCVDLTAAVDATTATQAAASQALSWGSKLILPAGKVRLSSTIKLDTSMLPNDSIGRFQIEGQGRGLTQMVWTGGNRPMFAFQGGTGFASHAHVSVRDLMAFSARSGTGTAISVSRLSDLTFDNVFIQQFQYAYDLTDILSSRWIGGNMTFNTRGLRAQRGSVSYPNALTFLGTTFGNNAEYALEIIGGSALTMVGGSIEGNGVAGSGLKRGGIFLDQPGNEGGVAATLSGVYFEANKGTGDVVMAMGTKPVSLSLTGNTFARVDLANYVNSNIVVTGASGAAAFTVSGTGNAFREAGTYNASMARPYIDISGAAGPGNVSVDLATNNFMTPSTALGTVSLLPIARVRFDGTQASPTIISGTGAASITKNAVGDYTINLSRASGSAAKSAVCDNNGALLPTNFGSATGSIRLRFNSVGSGALGDASSISCAIYDG